MNCPYCKSANAANAKFCTNCGAALEPQQDQSDTSRHSVVWNENNNTTPNTPPKPSKKKKIWLIIILVIVGIAIIGGLTGAFDEDENKKEKTETSESSQSSKFTSSSNDKQESNNVEEPSEESEEESIKEDLEKIKSDFKNECKTYTYKQIARNPNDYEGLKAKFEGQVIQVVEHGDNITMRVEITKEENQFAKNGYLYSDPIYVEYTRKSEAESRILDDDVIMMYGTLNGTKSYDTVLGDNVTIPFFKAEYIDIISD